MNAYSTNPRRLAAAVIAVTAVTVAPTLSQQESVDFSTETDIEKLYEIYINRPHDPSPGEDEWKANYEEGLALRKRLKELGNETSTYFLSQLRETTNISDASRIVTFFRQTGMARDEVLPQIRTLLHAHSEDKITTFLGAGMKYIVEYGTREDIELLEQLKDHPDGSVVLGATNGLRQLETRLGIAQTPKLPLDAPPQQAPQQPAPKQIPALPPLSEKPTPPTDEPEAEKPNALLFVVVGLFVVAIVVAVLRKARSQ